MSMIDPTPKARAGHEPEGWPYRWLYRHGITPNKISLARLALIPIIVFLISLPKLIDMNVWSVIWLGIATTILFLTAAATDHYDGELARRSGQITALGKFLDPLIDKGLIIVTLLALTWSYHADDYRWWIAAGLIAGFEITSTLLRSWIKWRRPNVDLSAQWWGKIKLVVQVTLVAILILVNFGDTSTVILWIVAAVTVASDLATISRLWREYKQTH